MKNIFLCLLICSAGFAVSAEGGILKQFLGMEYNYTETVELDIPKEEIQNKWKRAYANATQDGACIVEWIPKNESLNNRTELLTIQFFAHSYGSNKPQSAEQLANQMYVQLQDKYDMQWNTIKLTENDAIYEWILPKGYQNDPPQHEIVRIIWTPKGIHRVAYEVKTSQMNPQTRELWLDRISRAHIIN